MNIYKTILFYIILILSASLFFVDGYASNENLLSLRAMFTFLSWEKFWYGEFFGEECYSKLVGKKLHIAIQQEKASEHVHLFRNQAEGGQIADQKIFDVYIPGTNFLFHRVWLGEKPVAHISMGSAPPGCNVDDLEPRVADLLKDSQTSFIEVRLPTIKVHQLPSISENLKDQVVLDTVKRSMEFFIHSHYFEPVSFGFPQRQVSPELKEKIKQSSRILLARFNRSDPYLLVYYEGDNKIYLMDFPSSEILTEKSLYVSVYSASPYLGEVSKSVVERIKRDLLNKIKNNSIEIQLEVKNFGIK